MFSPYPIFMECSKPSCDILYKYIFMSGVMILKFLIHNILLKPLKKMSNTTQLALLSTFLTALVICFFAVPAVSETSANNANLYSEVVTQPGENAASGIGGGNIHGNCMAGKKALPIYSVDVGSKTKQSGTNSENPGSTNPTENSSTQPSGGQTQPSNGQKYISLSFDAAWGADDTIQILDILDQHNVKVTFFMTGGWVESFPDMVKEIYARGHDLGNHSQNHKQMSKLSVSEQKQEIMSVSESVKTLTGYDMFLFRPPYGDYNSTLIETVYGCNYYPIQWSVDSLDWKDYGVENIIKTVTQHKALDNGAIILMHNGAKFTAQALDEVITNLQGQGYTLVPISELIIRENFHMDGTGKQIAD